MDMDNEDVLLTAGQKLACYIVAGAILAAWGIFLLLCGTVSAFPFTIGQAIVPSGMLAVGLGFTAIGFIQKNVVSLWLGILVLSIASVSVFAPLFEGSLWQGYRKLYPIYIASPGIAFVATMIYSREFKDHLKLILFFFGLSAFFFLNSLFGVPWYIVLPLMLVSVGLVVVAIALAVRFGVKKEMNNTEN